MNADSKGYLLCYLWAAMATPTMIVPGIFFVPRAEPGMMPTELADPEAAVGVLQAAVEVLTLLGVPLDAAIGDVCVMGRPDSPLPADGGSGVLGGLKCLEPMPGPDGVQIVVADSWVSRVQLQVDGPPVADSLLVYGNTTDPAAPPSEDQFAVWAVDQLRPRD